MAAIRVSAPRSGALFSARPAARPLLDAYRDRAGSPARGYAAPVARSHSPFDDAFETPSPLASGAAGDLRVSTLRSSALRIRAGRGSALQASGLAVVALALAGLVTWQDGPNVAPGDVAAGAAVAGKARTAALPIAGAPAALAPAQSAPDATATASIAPAAGSPARSGAVVGLASPDLGERAKVRTASLDLEPPATVPLRRPGARGGPLAQAVTKLVPFDTAPFPYDGAVPGGGASFLNAQEGERKGHRTARGRTFWEDETFNDRRVLTHIPEGFDPDRPGVIVVFLHGHGATLKRDVQARQQLPAQISASGANAVLLAPQFAVNAPNSSAGKFWEERGFARFLDEGAKQLARLHGDPAAASKFATMPVVLVAYSGGFAPAAWALSVGGAKSRLRGVVLLDAMYGEHEKFASWVATSKSAFFVNASGPYTRAQAGALQRMLASRDVPTTSELTGNLSRGGVVFLETGSEANHRDYVTHAWTESPIRDVLARLPEYRLREAEVAVASAESRAGRRTAVAADR